MDYTIRQAVKEDLIYISQIEKECFPPLEAAQYEDFIERFTYFGDCFFVAENENQIIGFINGCVTDAPDLPDELYHDASLHKPNGDYQTVFGIDVLPLFQHRGIASALMRHFIANAKNNNRNGVILTCKDRLIGFYESLGYTNMGTSNSTHGGASWNNMLLLF